MNYFTIVDGMPEIDSEVHLLYKNLMIANVTFLTKIKRIIKFFV
jgi:hypothetical protein